MPQFILPLRINKVSSTIDFPYKLFKTGKIQILIKDFSIPEKESFFNLKNLTIQNNSFHSSNEIDISFLEKYNDFIHTNYILIIESKTASIRELQNLQKILDFVIRVVLGINLPIGKFIGETNFGIWHSNKKAVSRRDIKSIKKIHIDRITKLLKLLKNYYDDQKVTDLDYFLDKAMSDIPNLDVAFGFYISILEAVYAPEKAPECKYRLSMRMSKYKGMDYEYKKKINKLYDSRSKIFHGSRCSISKEDLIFLENEAVWSIEEFINNRKKFTAENLDKLILKKRG